MDQVTFETLPKAVTMLTNEVSELKRLLIEKQEQTPTDQQEQLLTIQAAAEFLNLKVPTIYSKVSKGELPVMKRSKRLYFSRLELMEYVKAGRKKSTGEIEAEPEPLYLTIKRAESMKNNNNNPLHKRLSKDTDFKTQMKIIFQYLQNRIATASMVSAATGVPQKNICRYKRDLEKTGRLWEVEKKSCKQTRFKAWYLTTNPEKAPINNQLKLF